MKILLPTATATALSDKSNMYVAPPTSELERERERERDTHRQTERWGLRHWVNYLTTEPSSEKIYPRIYWQGVCKHFVYNEPSSGVLIS